MSNTTTTKRVTYSQAVTQGRAAVRSQESASWTLGDIAANVAPKYGDNTLQKLAEDISAGGYGITYKTLINFRTVANAYAPAERSALNTFTVHVKFAKLDNRVTLVNSKVWTVAEAAEFVRKLNAGEIDANGNAYGDNGSSAEPADALASAETEVDRLFGELTKAIAKVNKLRRAAGLPAYAKVAQPAPATKAPATAKAPATKAPARRLPAVTSSGSLAEARTRHARTLAGVAK